MRILVFTVCQLVLAQGTEDLVDRSKIASLISAVKSGDKRQIVALIRYPISRPYPLSSIQNAEECLRRFDEVFDKPFLETIRGSDPKKDWELMGWRGIIFRNGDLWLDEEIYKIVAINHVTERTRALKAAAILNQKKKLPPSLRDFDEPVLEWETANFLLRVDKTKADFRLVVFDRKQPSKVLKVLHQGQFEFDGQLGDFHIDWQTEGKTHRISSESGGAQDGHDWYYVYMGLVDWNDWPERPMQREERR